MDSVETISHIRRDADGRAWIDDTNVKVIEVIVDHLAYGWSADEIHLQHPHLSLAQVHSALAFYFDHQPEFDTLIRESLERTDALAAAAHDSPGGRRLRAMGKLS